MEKPEYKGKIAVTDITSSSTAWLLIQGLISEYGEEDSKEILTDIYENAGDHLEESGSGSFGVESVLGSVVPKDGCVLLLSNGTYGERAAKMCSYYGISCIHVTQEYNQTPDVKEAEDPVKGWHIDFLISSANKCIQGVPGFSFIIANKAIYDALTQEEKEEKIEEVRQRFQKVGADAVILHMGELLKLL